MSTGETDDQSCIFVHVAKVTAEDWLFLNISVIRLITFLATGFIGFQVVFESELLNLVTLSELNTFLVVGIGSAVMYLILFQFVKFGVFKMVNYVVPADEEIAAIAVRSWLLSKSTILKQFNGWSQTFSATAVKKVVVGDHGMTLTFKSGEVDRLIHTDFASEDDFNDAKNLLTEAMNINKRVEQPPEEFDGELVVSGTYTKREQAVLRHSPSMQRRSLRRRLNVGVLLALAGGAVMLVSGFFSESGISTKRIVAAALYSAMLLLPVCGEMYRARLRERGSKFRWGVSPAGLSFSTIEKNYYRTNSMRWENLTSATEMDEGLLLSFKSPESSTLIPRLAVSAAVWDELVKRVEEYRARCK